MNHNSQSTSAEIRAAQRIGLIVMETIIDADVFSGDCYHSTPAGVEFAAKLRKVLGVEP